jgi:hypothetical protein
MSATPSTPETRTITVAELEERWQGQLSPRLAARVRELNLQYRPLTQSERDENLLRILNALLNPPVAAGPHRIEQWEKGWGENLELLLRAGNVDAVTPLYFGKHRVVRWGGELVHVLTPNFEYLIHTVLVDWVLETWLANVSAIYEFGCGPGYHLLRARKLFPDKPLVGLDWTTASQNILREMVTRGLVSNLRGLRFNFFEPDEALDLKPGEGIYSVAALEQIGDQHEALLEFLCRKRPSVCVHIEPIDELLDEHSLLGRLSNAYSRKRNYLENFLPTLQEWERRGRVRIHDARRTWTGSLFLDGHSLVVWSPV